MVQNGLWNIVKGKMFEDREEAFPQENGNQLREKAIHEEHCLTSSLREDVEGEAEEKGESEQGSYHPAENDYSY